jgi:Extensin-like protein C-terminus
MLGGISRKGRRKVSALRHGPVTCLCFIALLLGTSWAMTVEIVPLPRARPTGLPGDQSSTPDTNVELSPCRLRLAGLAEFKALPPITGPGECTANDVVALNAVLLPDKHRIVLSPSATLRCPMAEAVAHWLRDDVAPVIVTLGTSLRGIETLDSFECRRRNGIIGAKISEHGRANALDVRSFKLADGSSIELTDDRVSKSLRQGLRQSACAWFTTVLGNGADAYHESHVHLDLIERSNNYRICEWDVLDVAETAAPAARKAAAAAAIIPAMARDVPLPRPRPIVNVSSLPQHRREHFRDAAWRPVFSLITPSLKYNTLTS